MLYRSEVVVRLQGSPRANSVGLGQMCVCLRHAAVGALEAAVARAGVSSYAKSGRKFRIMTDSTRSVMHQVILLPISTPNFGLDLCEDCKVIPKLRCSEPKGYATYSQGNRRDIF
jgi:hypothetical protein